MVKLCILTCLLAAWLALADCAAPNCNFTSTQYTVDWSQLKDGNRWLLRVVFSAQNEQPKALWMNGGASEVNVHNNLVENGECKATDSTLTTSGNNALASRTDDDNGATLTEKCIFVFVDANTLVYAREFTVSISDLTLMSYQYLGVYTKDTATAVNMDGVYSNLSQACTSLNTTASESFNDYASFMTVCPNAV